jgi:Lactate racemase N-terminal domain
VRRVPLLSGSRVVLVPAGDDDVVVRPPAPPDQVVDAGAAVRDALRFPIAGPSLEAVVPRGGRATIVVEPPTLPLPGAPQDPRQDALAATIAELERLGISDERQTILVAGGLGRRLRARYLVRLLLPPPQARAFHGQLVVHDAESAGLVSIVDGGGRAVRVHPALVETDLTLVVSAAETVLHGGPGALLAAADAATLRGTAEADSLLEAAGGAEWELAVGVEEAIADRAPLLGVSLVLDLPRLSGTYRGFPEELELVERVAHSPVRALFSALPGPLRRGILDHMGRSLSATAAYAGPPSVGHAEALLRGIALRGTRLDEPVDALVLGVPWVGAQVPREQVNPVSAAAIALGLALRLRRDAFPIRQGGTLVLVHSLRRSFAHATQAPYVRMFQALRDARGPEALTAAERVAAADERALDAYRRGSACHPLQPFAEWAGCAPALSRIGSVVVAGCRDAIAARTLGFVPSRGIGSALEMAHGVAGGRARVGILVTPPYAPLLVG